MYCSTVNFKSYRCFEHLELSLDEKLTVIVAENGGGKTSILDGIAYLLGVFLSRFNGIVVPKIKDSDYRVTWREQPNAESGLEEMERAPYMSLEALFNVGEEYSNNGFPLEAFPCDIVRSRDKTRKTSEQQKTSSYGFSNLWKFADIFVSEDKDASIVRYPIVAYYGAQRSIALQRKGLNAKNLRKKKSRKDAYEFALSGSLNYQKMVDWLLVEEKLQADRIIALHDFEYKSLACRTIELAMKTMLRGFSNLRTKVSPLRVLVDVKTPQGVKTCQVDQQLSDGYRIVLALVLDLVSRLLKANGSIPGISPQDVLGSSGIVLIDEIDLHLHPRWQQTILTDLRETFPNIQFIVSTHSPQIVSSVPSKCIRLLVDGGTVELADKSEGLEASQILKTVFKTAPYPERNVLRKKLDMFLSEVYSGHWDKPEVAELGEQLRDCFEGADSAYDLARLHIENEKWDRDHA